jgi:membrane protein DedA with SNARE-associated domain
VDAVLSNIGTLASHDIFLAYSIIYVAIIFGGNIAGFTAFWVAFRGGLGVWGVPWVVITIFFAGMTGDLLWYAAGRKLRETSFGGWIKRRLPGHDSFEDHIERRTMRWMLLAKFVYGSNFPLIFSIGWTQRVPLRRFIKISFLALIVWLPILLGVSYGLYASLSPLVVLENAFRDIELLIAGIAIFILVQYFLVRIFRRLLGRNGKNTG